MRNAALAQHPLLAVDPSLAHHVSAFVDSHIQPSTQAGYDSATRSWLHFCSLRKISPFPPDPVWVVAWIVQSLCYISVRSMKVYLAALRSACIDALGEWKLAGNLLVARAMRAAKKRYGVSGKALKVPISLGTLLAMCKRIIGWPNPALMGHDDRVFIAASCTAVLGFLRGGEFLVSPKSGRPILRLCDILPMVSDDMPGLCVSIRQPKSRWWLGDAKVWCFDPGPTCLLNPSSWMKSYQSLSVVPLVQTGPAFVLMNGEPLSKSWMFQRTSALLSKAGISLLDVHGAPVPVRASSWRAGGVQSAQEAKVSDGVIMAMGRWTSVAWMNYLFSSRRDLRRAADGMWRTATSHASLLVGSFSPAGLVTDTLRVTDIG